MKQSTREELIAANKNQFAHIECLQDEVKQLREERGTLKRDTREAYEERDKDKIAFGRTLVASILVVGLLCSVLGVAGGATWTEGLHDKISTLTRQKSEVIESRDEARDKARDDRAALADLSRWVGDKLGKVMNAKCRRVFSDDDGIIIQQHWEGEPIKIERLRYRARNEFLCEFERESDSEEPIVYETWVEGVDLR